MILPLVRCSFENYSLYFQLLYLDFFLDLIVSSLQIENSHYDNSTFRRRFSMFFSVWINLKYVSLVTCTKDQELQTVLLLQSHSNQTWFLVGNKAKGWLSKRVLQENKARQIFRKTNISYPLIRTRTCAYQGVRNVSFLENLACFVFL